MPAGQNHSNFALNTTLSAPRYDTWCKIQVLKNFFVFANFVFYLHFLMLLFIKAQLFRSGHFGGQDLELRSLLVFQTIRFAVIPAKPRDRLPCKAC
jgi:hypothetical protein